MSQIKREDFVPQSEVIEVQDEYEVQIEVQIEVQKSERVNTLNPIIMV